MAGESLIIGNGNWGVKSGNLLGYNLNEAKYVPRELTFTRATTGTRTNGALLVESTPLSTPRIDYSTGTAALLMEPQRTNAIRNSNMVGASVSPSTLPTNWVRQNTSGLTESIVGVGIENGLNYIDINLSGTATGANDAYSFDQTISASIGQTWTNSWYFKLISSTPNMVRLATQEFNGVSFLNVVTQDITPTTNLARYAQTKTLVGTGVTNVRAMIYINFVIGQTYNTTIRIAQPQMELGAYATTIIPTTSASVTRNADALSLNNIYTNGFITSSGGTWFLNLKNNIPIIRDGLESGIFIDSSSAGFTNGFNIRNSLSSSVRVSISKWIAGAGTPLYATTANDVKIAIKWNGITADIFENGVKVISATSFAITNMEFLYALGNVSARKYIASSILFPNPLSDAECINITK